MTIHRWHDAFETGRFAHDDLEASERLNKLIEAKKRIETETATIRKQLSLESEDQVNTETVLKLLKDFHIIWQEASEEEKRSLIRCLIHKVYIFANRSITIEFN